MDPVEAVLEFAASRDSWQRETIRRLLSAAELTGLDKERLFAQLRRRYGLSADNEAGMGVGLPSTSTELKSNDGVPVRLNSLSNLVNTNRLATGQTLPFAIDGLTIIYGDNGSGKSGYCRVLKKLCRVRDGGEEEIRANAFDPSSIGARAEATVRFSVGDEKPREIRWVDGRPRPSELSRVSVFDALTARLYADQQNRVEFLPFGLHALTGLGQLCDEFSKKLSLEQKAVEARIRLPLPSVDTAPGAELLSKLTKTTPPQDLPSVAALDDILRWDEVHEADLAAREASLLSDAAALAKRCRAVISNLDTLAADLAACSDALGDDAAQSYENLIAAAKAADEAAALAASGVEPGFLLPGFGSEAWRELFRMARQYATIAYPGRPFPPDDPASKCVLCQQLLGDEALGRFVTFDEYVRGEAEVAARTYAAEKEIRQRALAGLVLRQPGDADLVLGALVDHPESASLIATIKNYLTRLKSRKDQLVGCLQAGSWKPFEKMPESPIPTLQGLRSRVEADLLRHEGNRDPTKRAILEREAKELRGRRTLAGAAQTIRQRREDLDTVSRVIAAKAACETASISRKSTELRQLLLTAEFRERLRAELEALDIGHIPFKVSEKSDRGASFVAVGVDTPIRVQNHDVLSAGEFRALAIACFLAEVNSFSRHDGIVIDDPVSSLDHLRARLVARRLVAEARARQVIVFTHDLVFFNELTDAAAELNVPVVQHWIRRSEEEGYGTIAQGESPWQVKPVNQRLDALARKLAKVRKSAAGTEERRAAVKDLYSDLRESWERLVEEHLFNSAVARLQLGVKTQSIRGVMVTDDDYKRIYFAMKRASTFSGHDQAAGTQIGQPTEAEIAADIEELANYSKELSKRRQETEARRRAIEKPPPGKTA